MSEKPKPVTTAETYTVGPIYSLTVTSKPEGDPGWFSLGRPDNTAVPPIGLTRGDAVELRDLLDAILGDE